MACAVAVVEDAEGEPLAASNNATGCCCQRSDEIERTYHSVDRCLTANGCLQETSSCGNGGSHRCLLTPGCNVEISDGYTTTKAGCLLAAKATAAVEDGDFQGPHDWRKRLKPVDCALHEKLERPNSGRTLTSRDATANGVDRKFKYLDSKIKFKDYDKTCERCG